MPVGKVRSNVLFWSGFAIYSGSKNKEAAWKLLRFYAGEQGAAVWKDWALPTVRSVAESSGLSKDPVDGVWLRELSYLAPRAYIFNPYWGQVADPALKGVLEKAITDPRTDIAALLRQGAAQAQTELDKIR